MNNTDIAEGSNYVLDEPFKLSEEQIRFYRANQFIKIREVFPAPVLEDFNATISNEVNAFAKDLAPLGERDTYGKAFIQMMNLWQRNNAIKALVFSKRLASIATQLLEVDGVRLYHDQALFKEPGGGITPWHADQYYWPLSSDKAVTAWIPLQETPLDMGPLEFAAGSHRIHEGRELQISDDSEISIEQKIRINDLPHIIEPFDLGEVSFHSGWIFHRAGSNSTGITRKVMTVIYMDEQMILKKPENKNQENDWKTWCPGAIPGEVIDTAMNPVLYTQKMTSI